MTGLDDREGSRLEADARYLSDPALDGRSPGSRGHELAGRHLERRLADLGVLPLFADGFRQPVLDGGCEVGSNVCGRMKGTSGKTVLIGAHYDHFAGIPGADDNAAALAIALDVARRLAPWEGESDVAFCFFDLEEPPRFLGPTMGSNYFVAHCPLDLEKLSCAIIMDLCGHDVPIPGAEDVLFVTGAEFSPALVDIVRQAEGDRLPALMARNEHVGDMSDHHAFRVNGLPFLFLSCGWWEHYHRPSDTFEKLNLAKMAPIAAFVADLVRRLDGMTVTVRPTHAQSFLAVEAETFRRLAGIDIPPVKSLLDAAARRIIRKLT